MYILVKNTVHNTVTWKNTKNTKKKNAQKHEIKDKYGNIHLNTLTLEPPVHQEHQRQHWAQPATREETALVN